jgi:type IV secretion system protein VirB9
MNRLNVVAGVALALTSIAAVAQDAARTVQYHSQDIVPIHAKVKYTTLIVVPPSEKIMEAATGDKDFWIVDVVGNFCFVHPVGHPNNPHRAFWRHGPGDSGPSR